MVRLGKSQPTTLLVLQSLCCIAVSRYFTALVCRLKYVIWTDLQIWKGRSLGRRDEPYLGGSSCLGAFDVLALYLLSTD